jgi:hypothetical protein
MRACARWLLAVGLTAGGSLAAGFPAVAQQPGGGISAQQADIGRVDTAIQRYGQALGVVTRLSRPLGAETECYGICFLPSSSRSTAWRCAPRESCTLHCDISPPVGDCR